MKRDDVFPSKFLKASDLPEDGSVYPLTIEKVEMGEIGPNKDRKPIIHFEETEKSMVCNKTNWNTIARATNSQDSDEWIGKTINLYRAEVEFQGEMVESIRVKIRTAPATTSKVVRGSELESDDVPF